MRSPSLHTTPCCILIEFFLHSPLSRIGQQPDQAVYDAAVAQLSAKLDVFEQILSKQAYVAGDVSNS